MAELKGEKVVFKLQYVTSAIHGFIISINYIFRVRNDMYGIDAWGEDGDYYNDRPGAQPPSPKHGSLPPQYASPGCNLPVFDIM